MKILGLIIAFIFAASSFAMSGTPNNFSVGKSLSVSGGYVSSLNKIDGTFSTDTTGWNASTGSITRTASTEFQGNYKGVWSGTGTGTLDLQWTATASNTYEASAQVRLDVPSDYSICAYVNSVETGCKNLLGYVANKIYKVSVVADSVISTSFYLRLKHTGAGAFNADIDDGKIEPYTFPTANFNQIETITYSGYSSYGTGTLFKTASSLNKYGNLVTVTTSGYTKYIAVRPCTVFVSMSNLNIIGVANTSSIVHKDASGTLIRNYHGSMEASGQRNSVSATTKVNAGDYFYVVSGQTPYDETSVNFSITAISISDYIIQTWQDGTEWTSYTPIFSAGFGTVTNASGKWKRSGSDLEVFVSGTVGTLAASIATVSFPTGPEIDSNKLTINNTTSNAGNLIGTYNFASAAAGQIGNVVAAPATSTNLFYFGTADGGSSSHLTPSNGNALGGSSVVFSFYAKVPIKGWSSQPSLYALPTRSELFSANVDASEVITNATSNFVTSCTNAAPSICSLWSSFGTIPICWAQPTDSAKVAVVSSSTATTTTVARTDTSTAFNLFCHLK